MGYVAAATVRPPVPPFPSLSACCGVLPILQTTGCHLAGGEEGAMRKGRVGVPGGGSAEDIRAGGPGHSGVHVAPSGDPR